LELARSSASGSASIEPPREFYHHALLTPVLKSAKWADSGHRRPDEINTNDGGRGVYFNDPSGHYLEIITRPYGRATL
jgi:hypothetical protein